MEKDNILGRIGNIECTIGAIQRQVGNPIQLPAGGDDGDVLIKDGNGLNWADPSGGGGDDGDTQEIDIPITSDGQILFTNVIPPNKTVLSLYLEGMRQIPGIDWERDGTTQNIKWINSGDTLLSVYELKIIVQ